MVQKVRQAVGLRQNEIPAEPQSGIEPKRPSREYRPLSAGKTPGTPDRPSIEVKMEANGNAALSH